MQVKVSRPTKTEAVVSVIPTLSELEAIKEHVLTHFQSSVKVPGFRAGKTPAAMLEKHVNPQSLQAQFLEEAIEQLYTQALQSQNLRPVDRPDISLKKFVPFTTLEFEAKVPVLGEVRLPDYKKIRRAKPSVKLTAKDVDDVIKSLQARLAEKKDVDRPAKDGDQVWIDFKGTDTKGELVKGAEGKDYPLLLGSNSFIPGFEANLIDLKANQDTTFDLTFPKDYGVRALANKKITFSVSVTKVQEVVEPKVDDAFAATVGPFQTVAELKADIKKQLTHERQHEVERDFESELITAISAKSTVDVPEVLIDDNVERLLVDLRQNLSYRGLTMQEFLESEGKTEDQYRQEIVHPQAEARVKASLVLAEIAEAEKVTVTPEELEIRMQLLKGQYTDPQMQAELNKPESRSDITSRLLTEKTIAKLKTYALAKS